MDGEKNLDNFARKIRNVEIKNQNNLINEKHTENLFNNSCEKKTGKKTELISKTFRDIFEKNKTNVGAKGNSISRVSYQTKNKKIIASIDIFSNNPENMDERKNISQKWLKDDVLTDKTQNLFTSEKYLGKRIENDRHITSSLVVSGVNSRKNSRNEKNLKSENNYSNPNDKENLRQASQEIGIKGTVFPHRDAIFKITNYLQSSNDLNLKKLEKKSVQDLLEIKNLINKRISFSPWYKILV